jgi:phosphoglycerate kinase
MAKLSIRDIALANKRVFIRVDFNVPLTEDGSTITDDTRIVATLPTIQYALAHRAKVILASHLGRPKGKPNPKYSLRPIVDRLRELLDKEVGESVNVAFSPDCVGQIAEEMARQLESGQVLLLENLRFHAEEEVNDPAFSKALASLAEVYVNDAFGSAHRAHASTEGITHYLKPAVAGLLMEKEITYLCKALESPEKPFVAIIGGSKISGKIDVIDNLLDKVDTLVIVGGMAYTFQRALGVTTGKSLVEEDKIEMAKAALDKAKTKGVNLLLPVDNILADNFAPDAKTQPWDTSVNFPADWQGLDIGPSRSPQLKKWSQPPAPSFGTAPPASLSSRASPWAPTQSPRLLQPTRRPSPSSAAATLSLQSTRPATLTRSPTSPPAAAPASNSWKAKSFPA